MPERFNVYRDGKVHVCAEECSTCVFRPDVRPVPASRVADMVRETKDTPGSSIVCHHTLDGDNAVCRGWYDRLADRDIVFRLAAAQGVIVEVPAS